MTSPPETCAEMAARLKQKPFYKPTLTSIDPDARAIFESYAHISPDQVLSHIQTIRDQAWELFPYPCIGMFSFIKMYISKNPKYSTVLNRLLTNSDETLLLDLGCGFGQELRILAAAGVPTTSLFGIDISDGFIELGFQLFNDKAKMQSQIVATDLLASAAISTQLDGKVNFIFAASFFHLFGWEDQLRLSKKAVAMLKPVSGSLIFGHQLGRVEAQEDAVPDLPSGKVYFHDPESFRRLWRVVGEATGTEWKVEVLSDERWIDDLRKGNPALRLLRFSIERL